jgi:Ran-binding protein 1
MADFVKEESVEKTEKVESPEKVAAGVEEVPAAAGGEEEGPAEQEESTAVFEAVVKLEEVETKTFEEDEDVLYTQRSKLFIYGESSLNKGTGEMSWNERGVGDAKILKHRENSRIRLLMRQDGTLKILTNHFIDPRIVLTPNAGTDKSWVWTCHDFAGGEALEEMVRLLFICLFVYLFVISSTFVGVPMLYLDNTF